MSDILQYFPQIFEAHDLQSAKAIILTNEGPGADTETRWEQETPYVASLIGREVQPGPGSVILDYGCGIGRIAKPLIERFGCHVIGVDISAAMRAMAPAYVADERFTVVSPLQFDALVDNGLRVDAAISIWVLQHCLYPAEDVERLWRGLKADGTAFVLNMSQRAVPGVQQGPDSNRFRWVSDATDVRGLLRERFSLESEGGVDAGALPHTGDADCFWMRLAKNGS